jgi:signal transduction histidine kinase
MVGGCGLAYRGLVAATLLRPWTTWRTWRVLVHSMLDALFGPVLFSIVITLLVTGTALLVTFPFALPVVWLLFVASKGLGAVERSRAAALLDADVPSPHAPLTSPSWFGRLKERVTSASRWREIAYHLFMLPFGLLSFAVNVAVWCGSLALAALPLYVSALPGDSAEVGLFDVAAGPAAWVASAAGILGLVLLAPWTTTVTGQVEAGAVTYFLGPSRESELAAEVGRIEASRAAAVDSAEAERRRIERDLHDGAQQRLVSLAMDLGMARQHFDDDPAHARRLVDEAHEEAKAALGELRDLVRGFHPAILEDRGLDAALSAVVARCPVPVRLDVDVSPRPGPAAESAAYYIVSEALTNVAKHSGATSARVGIARHGDRLVIDVSDNGRGGANTAGGTGLLGLEERVRALGGWLNVMSPEGGPTSVMVELPCAS